jgi:hypothetical protein
MVVDFMMSSPLMVTPYSLSTIAIIDKAVMELQSTNVLKFRAGFEFARVSLIKLFCKFSNKVIKLHNHLLE